jgi:hypothetical protein
LVFRFSVTPTKATRSIDGRESKVRGHGEEESDVPALKIVLGEESPAEK